MIDLKFRTGTRGHHRQTWRSNPESVPSSFQEGHRKRSQRLYLLVLFSTRRHPKGWPESDANACPECYSKSKPLGHALINAFRKTGVALERTFFLGFI